MHRFSGLKRVIVITTLLFGTIILAIEVSDSKLVLNSKTYELLGYKESAREVVGNETHITKVKRFDCLPGNPHMMFVHDSAGRTIARARIADSATAGLAAPTPLPESTATPNQPRQQEKPQSVDDSAVAKTGKVL